MHIGPHCNVIRVCQELPPLLAPRWIKPIFWVHHWVFVIFVIRALSAPWASQCPDVEHYKWRLNSVWHTMLYSGTHVATVGVEGLTLCGRRLRCMCPFCMLLLWLSCLINTDWAIMCCCYCYINKSSGFWWRGLQIFKGSERWIRSGLRPGEKINKIFVFCLSGSR